MAFTSIAWNGIGVIANCDALADSAGGTHAELGGGGISANTDNYLLPPASIGHVYASKSGFGYYTTPANYSFATAGNAEGQFIYIWIQIQSPSAFDLLANNGFSIVVGTDTSNYRTYKIAGSGAGEGKVFEGGGWKLFVIDPTIAGSIADIGVYDLATINMVGLWMDTIVSVRADTIFTEQISIGKGLRVTGTGTVQELVDYCTDYTNRAWGVFQKRGRIAFAYGSLTVGDNVNSTVNSSLTDDGNIIGFGFTEFWNGSAWVISHPLDYNKLILEKHASFTTDYTSVNTSLLSNVEAKLSRTIESGSTISLTGGALDVMSSFNTISGEVTKGKVLTDIDASSISNTPTGCTWNTSGLITVEPGGGLDSCVISASTGAIAVTTASTSSVINTEFISSGTGHAIEATTVGSHNWEDWSSGYGLDDTTDAVLYNNSGGHIDLSVIGNGVAPTVRNGAGASTTIISAVSYEITGLDAGAMVTIVDISIPATPVELFNEIAGVDGKILYGFNGTLSGTAIGVYVSNTIMKFNEFDDILPAQDKSFPISQLADTVYI